MKILKFDSEPQRKEFLETFETFLNKHDIKCNRNEMKTQMLISSAHTKEDRQKRLEKFFRVAFAHVSTKYDAVKFMFTISKKIMNFTNKNTYIRYHQLMVFIYLSSDSMLPLA